MATDDEVTQAANLSQKASEIADRLKPGTWEAVQTLALISIAKSLVVLADQASQGTAPPS